MQLNINGIRNKITELKKLIDEENIDIVTIQETKLTPTAKTPNIPNYSSIRNDRNSDKGGGQLNYIKMTSPSLTLTLPSYQNPTSSNTNP